MHDMQTIVPFMRELADVAAGKILPLFRTTMPVENKAGGTVFDPVTEADREAERAIRDMIQSRFPDDGIDGEEFPPERLSAERVWVLDPIDGTRAFISGLPLWGTLIGLMQYGEPKAGMIAQPYLGEKFFGSGGDAYFENRSGRRRITTRECEKLNSATLSTTDPRLFSDDEIGRYRAVQENVRLSRYGYDCYAYAMLAMGLIDCVIESALKPHDILPIIPIVEAAGGKVTNWQGKPVIGGGQVIAAGDPRMLDAALALLNA